MYIYIYIYMIRPPMVWDPPPLWCCGPVLCSPAPPVDLWGWPRLWRAAAPEHQGASNASKRRKRCICNAWAPPGAKTIVFLRFGRLQAPKPLYL